MNPYNIEDISKKIDLAINMATDEKEQRAKLAYDYISTHSTLNWAESFLKDLKRAH